MLLETKLTISPEDAARLAGGVLDTAIDNALSEAGAIILNRIRTNFLNTVDPDGRQWEPSFAAFQRSFGIGRKGGGTLFDTGRLFNSIQLFSVSPLEQAIATDVPYGPFLQYGSPARVFLGFGEKDLRIATSVLTRKIEEAMS